MEPEENTQIRSLIIGLLTLLSDLDEQVKYQENVPIADVPAELVCQWFDDHDPIVNDWFSEYFSPQEQNAIKDFHYFYDSKVNLLPETSDVHELHKSPEWLLIVQKAKETLNRIQPENA